MTDNTETTNPCAEQLLPPYTSVAYMIIPTKDYEIFKNGSRALLRIYDHFGIEDWDGLDMSVFTNDQS